MALTFEVVSKELIQSIKERISSKASSINSLLEMRLCNSLTASASRPPERPTGSLVC
jgi:hypothetical protein